MESAATVAAAKPNELSKKEQEIYRTFKGSMKAKGATDSDVFYVLMNTQLNSCRRGIRAAKVLICISIPLLIFLIGIPLLIISIIYIPLMNMQLKGVQKYGAMYAEEMFGEEISF